MLDPDVLPSFILAVTLVALAPGPDNTFIAAVGLSRGARAGALSAVGMALGMVVHVVAAGLGLALLLQSISWALTAVQVLGAGYLAYLALVTLRSARSSIVRAEIPDAAILRRAFITNLTNPKVILFFVAFLPQFTREGSGPIAAQLLSLGAVFLVVGLLCDLTIGVVAGRLGRAIGQEGAAGTAVSTVAGATFAVLALVLATEAAGF